MESAIMILKRNEIIFSEGDPSDCMYDIRNGRVGIFTNYNTKDEKLLTELSAGQFFGEMGIIEGYPRSATAVALGDVTEMVVVPKKDFEDYCKRNPEKAIAIMKNMSARIRDLTKDYLEVCHTVADFLEDQDKGRKNSGLVARLKGYAKQYNDTCAYAASCGIDLYNTGYFSW